MWRTPTSGSITVTLEQVQAVADPAALLLPVDAYFAGHPALTLTSQRAEKKVRNGNTLSLEAPDGVYRVYGPTGDFLALSSCFCRLPPWLYRAIMLSS